MCCGDHNLRHPLVAPELLLVIVLAPIPNAIRDCSTDWSTLRSGLIQNEAKRVTELTEHYISQTGSIYLALIS